MFAKDRDLVVVEPGLYRDVNWNGQRLISAIGSLNGTTLTLVGGSFISAGVKPGHVVMVNSIALEVISIQSATVATVSAIRTDILDAPIPSSTVTGARVEVYSFGPQIAIVHRQVLSMIGIDPDDDEGLGASSILNPEALITLEVYGALHLIYASAGAPGRGADGFLDRASSYQQRFSEQRGLVTALIDLDGDGVAETRRHPNSFVLRRN